MLPFAPNDPIQFLPRNNSDFLRDKDKNARSKFSPSELSSPLNSYQILGDNNKK
jgi:hypothetical protein